MSEVTIITNNVPRDVIDAYELTPKEREEFDYLDWKKIELLEDSAQFFRYKGELYDLGDFQRVGTADGNFLDWDGFITDSFFSGILIRYVDEFERVVVGRFYS
jgi:hypothetical protein